MSKLPQFYLRPLQQQLLHECAEMANYALSTGRSIPASVLESLQATALAAELPESSGRPPSLRPDEVARLSAAHGQLSRLIAPATPQALILMNQNGTGPLEFLGPIPFIRRMLLAALLCLTSFVALSLSDAINDSEKGDILNSDGLPLLINELFFMTAAGMGASFAALDRLVGSLLAGLESEDFASLPQVPGPSSLVGAAPPTQSERATGEGRDDVQAGD